MEQEFDRYVYVALFDGRLCDQCAMWADVPFTLAQAKNTFPYLEVTDFGLYPHVHVNCRCLLLPIVEDYMLWDMVG